MTSDAWLVNRLDPDVVFRVAIYKERVEANIDGVHCTVEVICPDNIVAYLAAKAVENATVEVKAAALQLLNHAYRCGALRHNDNAVFRRAGEIFDDSLKQVHYEPRHADEARGLMGRELRRCVVCKIDTFTLFEQFISCVETHSRSYKYAIRRPDKSVFYVVDEDHAAALHTINQLLMAYYRVVVDADLETFETLTRIYAKGFTPKVFC